MRTMQYDLSVTVTVHIPDEAEAAFLYALSQAPQDLQEALAGEDAGFVSDVLLTQRLRFVVQKTLERALVGMRLNAGVSPVTAKRAILMRDVSGRH